MGGGGGIPAKLGEIAHMHAYELESIIFDKIIVLNELILIIAKEPSGKLMLQFAYIIFRKSIYP